MSDEGGEPEKIEAALREWFLEHGFPPEALDQLEFSANKIPAQVYLDDRCIRFEGPGSFPTNRAVERSRSLEPEELESRAAARSR
jgi:hypothetical protein